MTFDVVIAGGGPAGLSAALALGRARKRVALCDSGPRRNAAALTINNFVTRDGTPPEEFRQIARQQLAFYPSVSVRDTRIRAITGTRGAFRVALEPEGGGDTEVLDAQRVLLCSGMLDDMLPIEGFERFWGHSIFQCPYCHGFEHQEHRWGYLPRAADAGHALPFALQALGWTEHLVLFTHGAFELPEVSRGQLEAAGVRVETARIERLVGDGQLAAVVLANGQSVPCEALFTHPPQRQVELVTSLDVALDGDGYVQVDAMRCETSIPGVYAAGDLTTRMQGAVLAAAMGARAAAAINVELMLERAARPSPPAGHRPR